jgi:hypothetical protein
MVCVSSGTRLPGKKLVSHNAATIVLMIHRCGQKKLSLLFNAQTLKLEQALDCHTILSKKKGGGIATYIKLHRDQEHREVRPLE